MNFRPKRDKVISSAIVSFILAYINILLHLSGMGSMCFTIILFIKSLFFVFIFSIFIFIIIYIIWSLFQKNEMKWVEKLGSNKKNMVALVLTFIIMVSVPVIIDWPSCYVSSYMEERIANEPEPLQTSMYYPLSLSRGHINVSIKDIEDYEVLQARFFNTREDKINASPILSCEGISIKEQESHKEEIEPKDSRKFSMIFKLESKTGTYNCKVLIDDREKEFVVRID